MNALAAPCIFILPVLMQAVPLVLAYLDGVRVLGVAFNLSAGHRLVAATRCVEALRPCVFVSKATAASATPLEKGAAAPGDVTHMSMSAKLSAEVARVFRLL